MLAEENGVDPRLQAIQATIRLIPHFPKPGPLSFFLCALWFPLAPTIRRVFPVTSFRRLNSEFFGGKHAGIMFNDITTMLLHPKAFKDTIEIFVERYRDMGICAVAGIEARGFIFGTPIALALGAKFIPLRKPKKLPGEVISVDYALEYGTDSLEMHVGAVEPGERVLIVDDVIATGGTLRAAMKLLERAGAEVVECACVIGLPHFKGCSQLDGKPTFVLVEYLK